MKKLCVLLWMLIPLCCLNAQSAEEIYRVLDEHRSMMNISPHSVSYYKVYRTPGKSREWLYGQLSSWVLGHYVRPAPSTAGWSKGAGKGTGIISVPGRQTRRKGFQPGLIRYNWKADHSLKIEIREGAARVTFTMTSITLNRDDISPTAFYPNKVEAGKGLKEYYFAFNYFMNAFSEINGLLTGEADFEY